MTNYRIVDLFAGIGGFRLGFENTGHFTNVFSIENDKFACLTYEANFNENPIGDITSLTDKQIQDLVPDFDVLLAGFPCQAFSIAGHRKGFTEERGQLFFDVMRFLNIKEPQAFLLENVKGLLSHDKGETFKTILKYLQEAGYNVFYQVMNSKDYGLPQNRERVFIVGFKNKVNFSFPEKIKLEKCVLDILEQEVDEKYFLSERYIECLKNHKERHSNKGNGFGFQILDTKGIANTLMARSSGIERNLLKVGVFNKGGQGDRIYSPLGLSACLSANGGGRGAKTGLYLIEEKIRKLTPRECGRLQGFPESFKIPVSDTQSYKQFGNSVSVPVVEAIARNILKALKEKI